MDQFVIEKPVPGHARLRCRGALDLLARPELEVACAQVLGVATRRLVVDLDEVEFIDCGSARLLDRTGILQERQDGEFWVVCNDDFLLRVLDLTGFSARHAPVPAVPPRPRRAGLSSPARARPSARRAAR